ncbi:MAG: phosphate ABC transporter permease PstA, partial [Planctomycetota bacterium]|nr:phosphate ABC transporter permease PstA [Planctomycetota bacterium]
VEHRRMMLELFRAGDPAEVSAEVAAVAEARRPVYEALQKFRRDMESMPVAERRRMAGRLAQLENALRDLLGPLPGDPPPVLPRQKYGQARWDRALKKLEAVLFRETWDYSDPTRMGKKVLVPRLEDFRGTSLEPLFAYMEKHARDMLRPKLTFYWRFLTDESKDAHFFGGIWPEMLGTIYLTIGAALFAVPMGIVSAVYLTEYAGSGRLTSALRTFIGALAGVPSIVFGLFGLAFFINTVRVSQSKSVLAGSLTLALLILPTIIRASEEAIRAVPTTYKEAALSLGAGKGRTILTVILPAALPGILTGIIISMGRAAGETAPIIFTAAVSVGDPLSLVETFSQPTPALPWNVYNLCTEHQKLDELRHVQFGMVLVLVAVVLTLNVAAIWLRARISRKLKG